MLQDILVYRFARGLWPTSKYLVAKWKRLGDVYQKGTEKVEQKFKEKIMNVLSKEDYFHKINYNKLSVLDNKPVCYCIVLLYGHQQIDLTSYFN